MADLIRYDLLVQDALRGVVRLVLTEVAKNGLQGDHHFFITFKTATPGLRLSNRMRERYPDEMTVILQHQFWGLSVTDAGFEVGLSFNNNPERLFVPFAAITMFQDPSVTFGLKFDVREEPDAAVEAPAEPPKALPAKRALATVDNDKGVTQARTEARAPAAVETKSKGEKPMPAADKPKPVLAKVTSKAADAQDDAKGGPKVVSIDAFRKKP